MCASIESCHGVLQQHAWQSCMHRWQNTAATYETNRAYLFLTKLASKLKSCPWHQVGQCHVEVKVHHDHASRIRLQHLILLPYTNNPNGVQHVMNTHIMLISSTATLDRQAATQQFPEYENRFGNENRFGKPLLLTNHVAK